MIGNVAVVVDSASYLPRSIVEQHGLIVVPLNVEIGGDSFAETELEADEIYGRLEAGETATTSQPSPGLLAGAYKRAADDGAAEILSVHIGANMSGTVNAARLAADLSPIPVMVADTGQASFAEGLCVLEAIEALERGESATAAVSVVEEASKRVGNVFMVKALDLIRRGGRADEAVQGIDEPVAGVPILGDSGEGMRVLGSAASIDEAVVAMAKEIESFASARAASLRVGIGHGAAPQIAEALRQRVAGKDFVSEIFDYIVGPVVGVHTGAGNAGAVYIAR